MQRPAGRGVRERGGVFQGVKEDRLRGDTLLTGVLLLESGANRSAEGDVSRTWEICLSRALPSSRAYTHVSSVRSIHSTNQMCSVTLSTIVQSLLQCLITTHSFETRCPDVGKHLEHNGTVDPPRGPGLNTPGLGCRFSTEKSSVNMTNNPPSPPSLKGGAYVVVVAAALGAERRLVVQLVLEVELAQVA